MACGTGSPSKAITGKGATLSMGSKVSLGTPGNTWQLIAEVSTMDFSGTSTDEDDVTNLNSPGGFKETLATLSDPGTMDVTGNYTQDASLDALRTAAYPDVTTCRVESYWWQVVVTRNDGSTDTRVFPAFIKTFKDLSPLNATAKVEFAMQLRITGAGTRTVSAPPAGGAQTVRAA